MATLKDTNITGKLSIPEHDDTKEVLDRFNVALSNDVWEEIGVRTDKSRIYIDQNKYKTIFCELRLYDQYAQMTFPVRYIDSISTDIEKSFCVGAYQRSEYPGAWFEVKCGKMGGSVQPYIYFNRGFVNGTEMNYDSGNFGLAVWGEKYM